MVTTIKLNYNKWLAGWLGWLAYLWSNGSAALLTTNSNQPATNSSK
jgi:hypothetical protein